jgi:DegV family protein with EDD domain
MRIGIVVDASCDLPHSYIESNGLVVVPGLIEFGERSALDSREPRETLAWYRRELSDHRLEARTVAPTIDQIRDLFLNDLVLRFDRVLMLCMSASRGRVFSHATQASYQILQGYREKRQEAELTEPFALRVLDTRNVGPGEGILAHEAVTMISTGDPPFEKLRRSIKDRSRHIVSYLVPDDLYYLRRRAVAKGENALATSGRQIGRLFNLKPVLEMRRGETAVVARIRGFERAVTSVLERARSAVRSGHVGGAMTVSYGGELRDLEALGIWQEFESFAARRQLDLHLSVMSATLAVNVGPGAFAIAWLQQ